MTRKQILSRALGLVKDGIKFCGAVEALSNGFGGFLAVLIVWLFLIAVCASFGSTNIFYNLDFEDIVRKICF